MTFSYHCEIRELPLRDPFGISRGTRRFVRNLFVRIGDGWGEGAPIYYKGQTAEAMLQMAQEWLAEKPDCQRPIAEIVVDLLRRYPEQTALAQAVDLALHDAWGKREGKPLYELWGWPWDNVPLSSFTIGMDELEIVMQKAARADEYPILKIKAGGPRDMEILQAIHDRTAKPLLVDANEGWNAEQTLNYLPRLEKWGVLLLEQPLPSRDREGYRRLREENPTHIPIFIDEGAQGPEDVEAWAGLADGINIKLAKCGGLERGKTMAETAKRYGLKVMLGCMIESSLGISAAANLAPLAVFADLDGAALLSEDPFTGMKLDKGRLIMPSLPGIGAKERE
ncbi:MAG: dipeptide epimerase [Candidatus Omnitrophota bacterium]